jgi:hypothetical protein
VLSRCSGLPQSLLQGTPFELQPNASISGAEVIVYSIACGQTEPLLDAMKTFVQKQTLPCLTEVVDGPPHHRPAHA